jgi:hypothetical protein
MNLSTTTATSRRVPWLDVGLALFVAAAAVPTRVTNLASFTGKGDEGIRAEQLLLMALGYRPVRDVFASQGPLSLDIFFPFFMASGQTLAGARVAVVVYSILTVVALYWVGRLVAGRWGGVLAAAVVLLSPAYLKNSRLALVEIPSVLPCVVAIGCALMYQRSGSRRWLVASGVMLAIGLCIKPMMVPAIAAVGLAVLLAPRVSFRDLLVFGAAVGGTGLLVVLVYGPVELFQQVILYRLGSRQAEGWRLADNWRLLWFELQWDQPAMYALAAVGALVLFIARPRAGLPLVAWAIATWAILLVYSPLATKHAAVVPPAMALLAGPGIAIVATRLWVNRKDALGWVGAILVIAMVGWYATAIPTVVARNRIAMTVGDAGPDSYQEESQIVQGLSKPGEYILVDDPYLAFLNRRPMPPLLVDTSIFRIRSGTLSGADVVDQAERHDVRMMWLNSDNLRQIKKFRDWADEGFTVIKIDERSNRKDRALYLRNDSDIPAARRFLREITPGFAATNATFDGQLALRGFALERADPRGGGSTELTMEWELVGKTSVDWHPVTFIRDRTGRVLVQDESSLGGGSGGTATWRPGGWVLRTAALQVPARVAPGQYQLSVGLYDSKARKMATVSAGSGAGTEEVPLATLNVR